MGTGNASGVLVCIAGMPQAVPTVRFGGLIAHLEGSPVTLLTVVASQSREEQASAELGQALALLADPPVRILIKRGDPVRQILRESRAEDYGLVVMGERESGLSDLFLSSVVNRVLSRSPVPVLVVKGEHAQVRRILICTAGRQASGPVIARGAQLAQAAGAQVTLLHVASPLPSMYAGLATMEEELSEILLADTVVARTLRQGAAVLDQHSLNAELRLRHGVAANEILAEAQHGDYDVIVIGHWPRAIWMRGLFVGDVAREVVDNARRPVLVVRHTRQ